ncbi:MAG: hypothetical protein JWO36_2555 [Myxococcales bacterium]|nr:hypothetical protein [Myxococcales bacterium]
MTNHAHPNHNHTHGPGCGHDAVKHDGHVDYLHDGHLHTANGEECKIAVDAAHPVACDQGHSCAGHKADHVHSATCGHPAVPHGDHTDYVVNGHLHNRHDGHCDDHGPLRSA